MSGRLEARGVLVRKARCNVLIRDARVYDGMGNEPKTSDVAIEDERIAAIGSLDV